MTSASVKDVGNLFGGIPINSAPLAAPSGKVSFQSVWDSQTAVDGQRADASGQTGTPDQKQPVKAGESLKARETGKTAGNKTLEKKEVPDMPEGEELKDAMEVLETAAVQLVSEISDTLGISPKEVEDLLTQMELAPTDLLQPENLSAFLLQEAGEKDSMTLLTNEALYSDYRQLMQQLEQLLSQDSGIQELDLEQLKNLVAQSADTQAGTVMHDDLEKASRPVVEITVEAVSDDPSDGSVVTKDGQTLGMKDVVKSQKSSQDRLSAGEQGGHKEAKEQGEPLFQQNLRTDNTVLQQAPTQAVTGGFGADTQDIMRQIMDYMKIQVKPDTSSLEMQLHPESLGTLHINVASKDGVLTASFVTQNEAVKAALESQIVQLKENFAEQGIKVETIEVTVQTHQFHQNPEQGQGQEQNAGRRSTRTRRIRLDGSSGTEVPENMNEEEQLAAHIMEAGGSTVNFTA